MNIPTLYKKDKKGRLIIGDFSIPELSLVNTWVLTEKINGKDKKVTFINQPRFKHVTNPAESFTLDKMVEEFSQVDEMVLIGTEPCHGENWSFILSDVSIDGIWLDRDGVNDVASRFGVPAVPVLGRMSAEETVTLLLSKFNSLFDKNRTIDGVIGRTDPLLFMSDGNPLMFKLEYSDIEKRACIHLVDYMDKLFGRN